MAAVKVSKELRICDEAIASDYFWSALATLDVLFDLLRKAFAWAEGCPCHGHLPRDGIPPAVCKRWDECPMRGLRLPDLAAGDLFDMFYGLQAQATADLLTRLPASLPLQERGALLFEFEIGRSFMFYTLCLKLACSAASCLWDSPP